MKIPKETLVMVVNSPNLVSYPRASTDSHKIPELERSTIIQMMRILLPRINHYSVDFISKKTQRGFSDLDFVRLPKYPLLGAYNTKTKRSFVNLSIIGKKDISLINPRNLYSIIFYAYLTKTFTDHPLSKQLRTQIEISDYLYNIFRTIFGKRYGIMAAYKEMIPKLRFIIITYVLVSFYGMNQKRAYDLADRGGADERDFEDVDFNKYDFYNIEDFIKSLSEADVLPGFDRHTFAKSIMNDKRIQPAKLSVSVPFFEDGMRFMATLGAADTGLGDLFPSYMASYNERLYNRIIGLIPHFL